MRTFRLFELSYVVVYTIMFFSADKITSAVTSMIGSIPALFVGVVLVLLYIIFLYDLVKFSVLWVSKRRRN